MSILSLVRYLAMRSERFDSTGEAVKLMGLSILELALPERSGGTALATTSPRGCSKGDEEADTVLKAAEVARREISAAFSIVANTERGSAGRPKTMFM